MKVTAILEDALIHEAIRYSNAKTITEAVKVALQEFIAINKLKELSEELREKPLEFKHSAEELRNLNRD